MKVTVIYQILLVSLLLVGCTKVDLCDETTHPHVVDGFSVTYNWNELGLSIIRKSKFPQNPKRSVRFSGKRTKRSVQKRKARNTQKAETKVL